MKRNKLFLPVILLIVSSIACSSSLPSTPTSASPTYSLSTPSFAEQPNATTNPLTDLRGVGFTLNYPSDWYAYQPSQAETSDLSNIYDLILSDQPGNQSPQGSTPDEQARITIWHIAKPNQTLESWVAEKWAWMNTDIRSASFGGKVALNATLETSNPPLYNVFYWLEIKDYIYIIQAYSRTDVATKLEQTRSILSSLMFGQ